MEAGGVRRPAPGFGEGDRADKSMHRMTQQRLAGSGALALLALLTACGGYGDVRNLAAPGEAIVCFGDSLTAGQGAPPGGEYPTVLAGLLNRKTLNAGVSGDTTAAALRRIEPDVLAHRPRLVIVCLGGNDFLQQRPKAEAFQNLGTVVGLIQEAGAMVVLVGVRLGLFVDEYAEGYAALAAERGCLYIPDILDDILDDDSLKADNIHPNAAGYRLMAERIAAEVKPLLEAADQARG